MTLRLVIALLALLLSLPATASVACHEAPMTTASTGHAHHAPERRDVAPPHVCIGCAPVGDWLRVPLIAPIATPVSQPVARETRIDLGGATPPALPPPRMA